MRLLLVSDLHYSLRQYDWVLSRASEFDAVILAGDLLAVAAPVAIEVQIVAVRATLRKLAGTTKVIVCSGNQDLNALDEVGEKTADWLGVLGAAGITTDGQSVLLGDTLISVLPWWDGPVGQAACAEFLGTVDRGGARHWVWVYHSPPRSKLSWTGSQHFGDSAVAAWIERWRPTAVCCGHIHQAPFTVDGSWVDRIGDTWVFNPGKQSGPVPTWVELDFGAEWARWHSLLGIEERSLPIPDRAQP
jgi:Icc-related predicted phosphoesterase